MVFLEGPDELRLRRWAPWALALVTLVWGLSFPWTKTALDAARDQATASAEHGLAAERAGLLLFTGLRFAASYLVLAAWNRYAGNGQRARAAGQPVYVSGAVLGGLLIAGMLLNSEGLRNLEPAVSAFLTSLYVLFTALFFALLRRRMPRGSLLVGVAVATLGAAWIDGPPQLNFGLPALLTVISAALFALQILAIDRYGRRVQPLVLTEALFAVAAAVCGLLLVFWLAISPGPLGAYLFELLLRPDFWRPLLLMVLFASLFALTSMQLFQRFLDPVRAALLYALEPVWAALYQGLLTTDGVDAWALLGGGLVLLGNLVAELWPRLVDRHRASAPADV